MSHSSIEPQPAADVSPELLGAWSDAEGAARATATFAAAFDGEPDGVWFAPGRVNLIGEHTDYNGGLALPIALAHRTFAAVRRRDDGVIRLVSGRESVPWQGRLDDVAPGAVDGWAAYVAGVAWALGRQGRPVTGFDAAIESCVPYGAGLSSSAALEGAVAVALADAPGWDGPDGDVGRAELAHACVRAENEIAGANTGGMDQAASLRSREGHALLLDCRDGAIEHLPFDLAAAGLELLVIDTRAPHALVDGQYAQRRATCEAAAAALGVATLREIGTTADALDAALARLSDGVSRARVRHVVTEIERVRTFVDLLTAGRLREVGPVMDASHTSLRDDYEVSCRELDVAVTAARAAGALGARMTGGGFGGSAIALIPAGSAATVSTAVENAFAEAGLARPLFLVAIAGDPAGRAA